MPTEMEERVAKAMAERCNRSHDWPFWLDEARAALEAVRNMTDGMKVAALKAGYDHFRPFIEDERSRGNTEAAMAMMVIAGDGLAYVKAFQAAIDHCLGKSA